jgi:hypothetical protein
MPVARRTKSELEVENARLSAEVTALREFVFDIDSEPPKFEYVSTRFSHSSDLCPGY